MRLFMAVLRSRHPVALAVKVLLLLGGLLCVPTVAYAAVGGRGPVVFNTFLFIIFGVLVMWMCAGFTMLESGSVRTKNASMICLKNIGLYSIAGLAYYFIGYNLMYVGVGDLGLGGVIGSFTLLYGPSADDIALVGGNESAMSAVVENGYATMADWFFQMVFVATAASSYPAPWRAGEDVVVLPLHAGADCDHLPVVGAWTWGGGWLSEMGFQDFAGSTIVHSTGGWAALAGVLVVGPRLGKFRRDGSVRPTPPSNILLVTLVCSSCGSAGSGSTADRNWR